MPANTTDFTEQHRRLAAEWDAAETGSADELTAGRVWGMPELDNGDCWVDAAGASVLIGVQVKTITSWLARGQPRENPFPTGHRLLYRLYWPLSEIQAWQQRRPQPPAAEPVATDRGEDGANFASARHLRPGEQLRFTQAQLDAYTLTDASPTGTGGAYRVEIAGVQLGSIERSATRRTGWQARSLQHQPLGKPVRTRQDAVVALLQHLDGPTIERDA